MPSFCLLINRDMGSCHQPTLIQGWGGEQIGVSRYSTKHNCHIFEMPVDAYNKVAQSLMRASHIALRRWEPQFVEETVPDAVREFWQGYKAGMDGKMPENASVCCDRGYWAALAYADAMVEIPLMFPGRIPATGITEIERAYDAPISELAAQYSPQNYLQSAIEVTEPVTAQTHHKTLERIARDESIDLSGIHGTAAKAQAITEARSKRGMFEEKVFRHSDHEFKSEMINRIAGELTGDPVIYTKE